MTIVNDTFEDYLLPDSETMNLFFSSGTLEQEIDDFPHYAMKGGEEFGWQHAYADVA